MARLLKIIPWWISILLLSAFALYYAIPPLMRIPDNDYSIFQYVGDGIRHGELPYRDRYDHKPPSIFYLDALGLALGQGSRWGIWALELVSLTSAGLLCAGFLRRYFGQLPAALATAAFLLNLTFFHQGGNLTEEYALPFQFGALVLLSQWETSSHPGRDAFWAGMLAGWASTFKQPLGALLVAVGCLILAQRALTRQWRMLTDLLWLGVGFAAIWLGWFAFFAIQGIWGDFWNGAFAYNFALSGISTPERIQGFLHAIGILFRQSPFFMIGLLAWVVVIPYLLLYDERARRMVTGRWLGWGMFLLGLAMVYNGIFRRGLTFYTLGDLGMYQGMLIGMGLTLTLLSLLWVSTPLRHKLYARFSVNQSSSQTKLFLPLVIAMLDLPVQIGMITLSGDNFSHYYMAVFPSITILAAFFLWYLVSTPPPGEKHILPTLWAMVLAIPLLAFGAVESASKIHISQDRRANAISNYVISSTTPEDPIFFWGNYAMVYTISQRQSPSRYFVTSSLFLKNFTGKRETGIFLGDLQGHPPRLIIGSGGDTRPLLYIARAEECDRLLEADFLRELASKRYGTKVFIPQGMDQVYAWICKNYSREVIALSDGGTSWEWTIYSYHPNRPE